jgi:hypothetical protein
MNGDYCEIEGPRLASELKVDVYTMNSEDGTGSPSPPRAVHSPPFKGERKPWSRLPCPPRGIHYLPRGHRRRANTRKGSLQTSPKRLCRELWSEGHLPRRRKAM